MAHITKWEKLDGILCDMASKDQNFLDEIESLETILNTKM